MSAVNRKVVLITGGARGVGAEVARRLHAKGANVVLYCPDYVSVLRWIKPLLLATRLGESTTLKSVPELLPQMDAEVEALGRSLSGRTQEVEK